MLGEGKRAVPMRNNLRWFLAAHDTICLTDTLLLGSDAKSTENELSSIRI